MCVVNWNKGGGECSMIELREHALQVGSITIMNQLQG